MIADLMQDQTPCPDCKVVRGHTLGCKTWAEAVRQERADRYLEKYKAKFKQVDLYKEPWKLCEVLKEEEAGPWRRNHAAGLHRTLIFVDIALRSGNQAEAERLLKESLDYFVMGI